MTQGGRRRRSEEQPDSAFGKALKMHRRRIEGFTQVELSRESLVAGETISRMVKGKRVSGPSLRSNLRAIIKALHRKKALLTLDEANALMLTIPANSVLDERDPADAEIIALFDPPVAETEQVVRQSDDDETESDAQVPSNDLDDVFVLAPDIEPELPTSVLPESVQIASNLPVPDIEPEPPPAPAPPLLVTPAPIPIEPVARNTRRRLWWYISSVLTLLVIIGLIFVATHQEQGLPHQSFTKQPASCSAPANGVTLYTDINYKGQCHTFVPGDYELALYGLERNVSSIRDWNDAYFVKIFDTGKNFYDLDKSIPALPGDWDNRADMLHIEKHRPTSCHPGRNGIIAYINPDYAGGCLFITGDIPDLTPSDFDSVIVSIQFVGSYRNTMQLVIYSQPNYRGECGAFWQNQSDLEKCARLALSVRVLPLASMAIARSRSGPPLALNLALIPV